jgi:hypothetical protein
MFPVLSFFIRGGVLRKIYNKMSKIEKFRN